MNFNFLVWDQVIDVYLLDTIIIISNILFRFIIVIIDGQDYIVKVPPCTRNTSLHLHYLHHSPTWATAGYSDMYLKKYTVVDKPIIKRVKWWETNKLSHRPSRDEQPSPPAPIDAAAGAAHVGKTTFVSTSFLLTFTNKSYEYKILTDRYMGAKWPVNIKFISSFFFPLQYLNFLHEI